MNIADATKGIKKELSGDEKVLESVFKLETLYKKYKFLIWAIVLGLILFFVGRTVMQGMHEAKLEEANVAFLALQKNDSDTQALVTLKAKNPALFELFSYAKASKNKDAKVLASLTSSSNEVIADASAYAVAVLENKSSDSKLYKEMAIIEEAYLNIKAGDIKSANAKLDLIAEDSALSMLASLLRHSTLKTK